MAHAPLLLGADHAGFALKETLKTALRRSGIPFQDLTPVFTEGDDYPPIASRVAKEVGRSGGLGVLVCGTGHGMDVAANRRKGIRAIVARTPEDGVIAREHNHANILVLGGRVTTPRRAAAIVRAWLHATPSRAERHVRRVQQLDA